MSYTPEDWTVSSNEALKISITDSNGSFQCKPLFTYPIFGDSEQIFGYKDLEINLVFDNVTFLPLLTIKYSAKLNDDVEDIQAKLLEFLPSSTILNDELRWIEESNKEKALIKSKIESHFKIVDSYINNSTKYNVFRSNFQNDFTTELNKRLQILVLLYIEAGSYIDSTDPLWEFYIVLSDESNDIVAFTTTYSYFKYNGFEEFDSINEIKTRNKISQFITLPHQQHKRHGSHLYNSVVNYWLKLSTVEEITIEDPNESFDDLRYLNDFKRLFELGLFSNLPAKITDLNNSWFKVNAKKYKLELNQFKKLIEIGIYYNNINNNNKNLLNLRLLIKKRLYEKNKDGLLELEKPIRNDKLQTAYERIKQDYSRLIEGFRLRDSDLSEGHLNKKQKV